MGWKNGTGRSKNEIIMKILEGLLTINGVDIYKEYNAFLAEDSAAGHSNYDELLKVPAMKAYTTVSFREENGERLPDVLPEPHYEARDVTLQFGILTGTKEEWYRKFVAFRLFLEVAGWYCLCRNWELPTGCISRVARTSR